MPVYSCALIEPAVAKTRVHAHNQIVLSAKIGEVGYVEAEWSIAVVITPDKVSVQEYQRAAEGAIKQDAHAPAGIFFRKVERAAVPSNAGFRIAPPERFVAVALLLVVANEGQLHRPVVRQVERAPFRIIKFHRGKLELSALGEISLAHAEAKLLFWIGSVSLKELPSKVEQQMLARRHCRRSLSRRSRRIPRQQRMCPADGTAHESCG